MQTLNELFEKFIKERLRGNGDSPVTINNYRENFDRIRKFKPDLELGDLKKDLMIDFMDHLNTCERKVGRKMIVREYKKSSIATVRGKLSTFFTWLVENEYLKANPFNKIPYPDVSYDDKRAFTRENFDAIWKAVSIEINWPNFVIKKRNMAMVMFMSLTGVRKGELLGLKIKDFDMAEKEVAIRGETSKSKRNRTLPLLPELISYLKDYLAFRADYKTDAFWVSGNEDRPFTYHGAKHFVDRLKSVTGINCHLHRFRHTFAVNYYTKTRDIVGLQKLLGHRSLKMTLSYLRSLKDDHAIEQMRKMSVKEFV